ncbi:hypothetical protein ACLOJK_031018 [Asimina triloba]
MEAASSIRAAPRVSTLTLSSFKALRNFSSPRPIPGNFIQDRQYQNSVCIIRAQKPTFVPNYANSIEIKEWELARMQDELAASQGIRIRRRPPTAPPLNYMGPFEFCLEDEDISPRNILEEIIWQKDKEVSQLKERMPLLSLKREIDNALPVRDFLGALKASYLSTGRPALVAEVKKASPSRGVLREDFDPVQIAHAYEKGGAACLSVLTDEKYFQGGFENLEAIRNSGVKCPLLCKEFIIDAWQIYYARLKGADAVLLIAAVLPDLDIRYMIEICKMLGLVALVEVHNEWEMDRVLGIHGIQLIGINNRDLETFNVDISNTKKLLEGERGEAICERDIIVVGESGLFTPDDITYVQNAGVKAVLVGESIVKQSDPTRGITALFGTDISVEDVLDMEVDVKTLHVILSPSGMSLDIIPSLIKALVEWGGIPLESSKWNLVSWLPQFGFHYMDILLKLKTTLASINRIPEDEKVELASMELLRIGFKRFVNQTINCGNVNDRISML